MYADKAIYNRNDGIVQVSGNVSFVSGGDTLSGESGTFNLKDQTGEMTKGILFIEKNHYYISGDSMEKLSDNRYRITNCRLTTCDGPNTAWSITGKEVEITVEGYGKVKNAALRLREIPFIFVPYFIFPAKTERQTGFLPPGLGYSTRNGAEIEIPFFWAISDQADATFYERIISHRGLMQGIEFRYKEDHDSEGIFLFDILDDKIDKKDLTNPGHVEISPLARTNETRYWFRGRIEQELPQDFTMRLDTDFVSDQDYLREFTHRLFGYGSRTDIAEEFGRSVEEIQSPTRRSALRINMYNQDYSFQALSEYHQRPENPAFDDTAQPLAGLDFSFLPKQVLSLPLRFSVDSDYNYIWREFGMDGHSFSVRPEVSYPMWLGHYLELEPSIGFESTTQWIEDHPTIDSQSKNAYVFQTRLSSALEKYFDLSWRDINRLRHKIVPNLIYQYRIHRDDEKFQPWFEPIDFASKINRVAFSFDNYLDARKEDKEGGITYDQIGMFRLIQPYDIDESRRDEEPWRRKEEFEPLMAIASFRPMQDLDLNAETWWDHYDDDIIYSDLSLSLSIDRSGDRKDSYSIDYEYRKNEKENLNLHTAINLVERFSIGADFRRDLDAGHTIERNFWIEYLAQCWGVRFSTGKLENVSSLMITFRLVGLGDIGF